MTVVASPGAGLRPFLHEAFLYADDDQYLAGTLPFVTAGLEAGEPVMVALPTPRLDLLRAALGDGAGDRVRFAAMEEVGRNPGWIIPAWADFVAAHADAGRPARGIGEPIWAGRSDDELVECCRHESLLNMAFAGAAGFTLLCPYDTSTLGPAVIEEAHRNHPRITRPGGAFASPSYDADVPPLLTTPLPPPPPDAHVVAFDDVVGLGPVRRRVAEAAATAGLDRARADDLVLAVSEAISNSVRHGGGSGHVTLWSDGHRCLCDVHDRGRISDPLAGRTRPGPSQPTGRGLWLMHQLCDLVQLRAVPEGQVVRLHMLI